MVNYKININNGLDIQIAITALKDLGYELGEMPSTGILHVIYAMSDMSVRYVIWSDGYDYHGIEAKDLTIPQLQDLVVLHRNLIDDANYSILVASDIPDYPLFKSSEGIFYSFAENPQKWVECKTINDKTTGVRKLKKDQTSDSSSEFKTIKVEGLEGLIDGKAALAAALNGEEIQMTLEPWESSWQSFNPELEEASTKAFWTDHDSEGRKVFFRIKPNNFLINGMEVPAPLAKEPMGKIPYFYLRPDWEKGYCQTTWEDIPIDRKRFSNGIWATESEIRQVVAAFRKSIQELSNA